MVYEIQWIGLPVNGAILSNRRIAIGMSYLRKWYAGQKTTINEADNEYVSGACRCLRNDKEQLLEFLKNGKDI